MYQMPSRNPDYILEDKHKKVSGLVIKSMGNDKENVQDGFKSAYFS